MSGAISAFWWYFSQPWWFKAWTTFSVIMGIAATVYLISMVIYLLKKSSYMTVEELENCKSDLELFFLLALSGYLMVAPFVMLVLFFVIVGYLVITRNPNRPKETV